LENHNQFTCCFLHLSLMPISRVKIKTPLCSLMQRANH